MTTPDIIRYRLINQQIAETKFKKPAEIVSWMVAMQAQDFSMAKWAIGLRLPGINDNDVENAFNNGTILRTHLMRPTWHFITPGDIRWMLMLTAPRVNAVNAFMYRKMELDNKIFKRSNDALLKALQGGKQLTRTKLQSVLKQKKIVADGIRLSCLMMRAELDGIICSGPREGKQFTYALLDERVAESKILNREEALAELTRRYFKSRGPATIKDFVAWSGLTMKDAKAGIVTLGSNFMHEVIHGSEYFFAPTIVPKNLNRLQTTFLLPDYDEYAIGYKDRSAVFDAKNIALENHDENPIFNHVIIVDGVMAGMWQRMIKNKNIIVETSPLVSLSKPKVQALAKAIKKYSSFWK
jgi:hypothetical protein